MNIKIKSLILLTLLISSFAVTEAIRGGGGRGGFGGRGVGVGRGGFGGRGIGGRGFVGGRGIGGRGFGAGVGTGLALGASTGLAYGGLGYGYGGYPYGGDNVAYYNDYPVYNTWGY